MRAVAVVAVVLLAGCSGADGALRPAVVVTEVVTERVVVPATRPVQPQGYVPRTVPNNVPEELEDQQAELERQILQQDWEMRQQQAELERQLDEKLRQLEACMEREREGNITLGC